MISLHRPEGPLPEDLTMSRRAIGGLFFAGYAVAAYSVAAEPIQTDGAGLTIEAVTLPAKDFAQAGLDPCAKLRG